MQSKETNWPKKVEIPDGHVPSKWLHDLNNSFAGIRMQVLLARMKLKKNDGELRAILQEIEAGCDQVAELLGQQTVESKAQSTGKSAGYPDLPHTSDGKKRGLVLLMDDNESLRVSLAKILNECGYEVVLSSSGENCVVECGKLCGKGRKIDVVVLDVKVPGGLGGVETLKRLRQIDPQVRAIVSSGYSGTDVMSNYKQYGFSGALHKPFRIQELVDMIEQLTAKQA